MYGSLSRMDRSVSRETEQDNKKWDVYLISFIVGRNSFLAAGFD
jgi:hypothetical protein